MNKTSRNIGLAALFLSCSLFCGGCVTAPVVSKDISSQILGVDKIFLATPIVECIDKETGNYKGINNNILDEIRSVLIAELRSGFIKKQIAVSELNKFLTSDSRDIDNLQDIYRVIKLDSSSLSSVQQESLSGISLTTGASHILFCRCRLYADPGGFWNPTDGFMTYGNSRMVVEIHLYSIKEKQVVWKRTSQVRVAPSGGKARISIIIDALLTKLEVK